MVEMSSDFQTVLHCKKYFLLMSTRSFVIDFGKDRILLRILSFHKDKWMERNEGNFSIIFYLYSLQLQKNTNAKDEVQFLTNQLKNTIQIGNKIQSIKEDG